MALLAEHQGQHRADDGSDPLARTRAGQPTSPTGRNRHTFFAAEKLVDVLIQLDELRCDFLHHANDVLKVNWIASLAFNAKPVKSLLTKPFPAVSASNNPAFVMVFAAAAVNVPTTR